MPTAPRKKPKSPKTDAWESNRQKFYMLGPQFQAFAKVCEIKGKSASAVLARLARGFIRQNAPLLHKAGHSIPPEVFTTK